VADRSKLRPLSAHPNVKPICSFCGVAEDCLRHWFGPNQTATLGEGIWLARCHGVEEGTNQLIEKQARKKAASRQAKHRAEQRSVGLQASLLVYDKCGQVYGVPTVHDSTC
jgi:hypothetical protein